MLYKLRVSREMLGMSHRDCRRMLLDGAVALRGLLGELTWQWRAALRRVCKTMTGTVEQVLRVAPGVVLYKEGEGCTSIFLQKGCFNRCA